MNKLTIQINNLEALERLIGGDSEIEIDIRNSVVQKFAEKHLKAVVNSSAIDSALRQIQTKITDEISNSVRDKIATFKQDWYGAAIRDIKLHTSVISEIERQVLTLVEKTITQTVEKAVERWSDNTTIEDRINKRFEYYGTDLINEKIKAKIEDLKKKL